MNFREERRLDKANEAEQRRADAQVQAEAETARLKASAEAEAVKQQAVAEANRQAERDRRSAERQADKDKAAAAERRRQLRRDARTRARDWAGRHVVELLIYPIALVAFVLAAPAMADYGRAVYDSDLGIGLPLITELAMWAFAIAVQLTRHRNPDASTARLQMGVWVFSAIAAGLNLAHGMSTSWDAGAVMGIIAVSGIVAHQLAVAAPPRSRAERAEARITRREARKRHRIRKAAVDQAVAEVDEQGRARLVYRTGRVALTGRVRPRLTETVDPVDPDGPGPLDAVDHELAALIESTPLHEEEHGPDDSGDDTGSGGVDTLDAPQKSSGNAESKRRRVGGRKTRSMDELRAELAELVRSGRVDPHSAESIRHGLRCAKRVAQQLRDEYTRR